MFAELFTPFFPPWKGSLTCQKISVHRIVKRLKAVLIDQQPNPGVPLGYKRQNGEWFITSIGAKPTFLHCYQPELTIFH